MNADDSLLDIANTALAMIGAKPIASFDEDSKGAESCRLLLRRVIERAQGSVSWHELKKTVELVPTGAETYSGLEYNMPSDCLKILCGFVGREPEDESDGLLWEQAGQLLYFKEKDVKLRYIRYSENPGEWSVDLRGLATEMLASEIVGAVTGEWNARYRMQQAISEVTLPRAVAENAKRNPRGNFYRTPRPRGWYFE